MRLVAAVLLVGCGRVAFEPTADAAPDADLRFCAMSTATFCSDFDDGTLDGWVEGGRTNGDYINVFDSMRSSMIEIGVGEIAEGYVNHHFNATASRIKLDFDLRITQRGQGDVVLGQVRFLGAQDHGFEYVYRANGSYAEEFRDNQYDSIPIAGPAFPVDEWHRVEMDMDLRTSPRVIVKQDSVTVIDSPLLGNVTGTARISVGLVYLRGPSTPWTLFFDNVSSTIE